MPSYATYINIVRAAPAPAPLPLSSLQPLSVPPASPILLTPARHRAPQLPPAVGRGHRIMAGFGLGGTLQLMLFPPLCHRQGPLPPAQGARSPVSLALPALFAGSGISSGEGQRLLTQRASGGTRSAPSRCSAVGG